MNHRKVRDLVYIAMFAVIMAVCSWICIPGPVPFTLQTFAVFMAVGTLGGKRGTAAVVLYLLMGAVGLPVFSGFSGGPGALLGCTGGYIAGFLFSALIMWLMEASLGRHRWVLALSMVLGLLVCYLFGTVWFAAVYARTTGPMGFGAAFMTCVVPYLIPDGLKLLLAMALCRRLSGVLKLSAP